VFTTLVNYAAGATDPDHISLQSPISAAVDLQGNIYVTNDGVQDIRKVLPDGSMVPFAGAADIAGSADGTGTAAEFDYPCGIAVDAAGTVYVADKANDTVRKITPAGVVTTVAGTVGMPGSADGPAASALFNVPYGVAVDAAGNIYVSEQTNCTIRKITPAGVVSTLAGLAGAKGSADGTGSSARFDNPANIAIDASGNIFVADTINDEIRKVTPAGVVTTLAGSPGQIGSTDGTGSSARFYVPYGIAVDGNDNVFVADTSNYTIREVTQSGVVTTVGGVPQTFPTTVGGTDGVGAGALFNMPFGIAVDGSGNLYVVDTNDAALRKGSPYAVPQIVAQPADQFVVAGGNAIFATTASGPAGLSYQWSFNGTAIAGATGATYTVNGAQASNAGSYAVTVSDSLGSVTSSAAKLDVGPSVQTARLINISTRAQVGTGANILIPGFVIEGNGSETLLIRADGPALAQFSVSAFLAEPSLGIFDSTGAAVAANIGWGSNSNAAQIASVAAQVNAFALPAGSADCALLVTLPAGAYTVHVSGVNGTTGIALAEIYEVSYTGTRLVNISTRAQVGTGANVLIPGFVISGGGSDQLLVRADGPVLSQFGVSGILAQPSLSVYDNSQAVIASDTGWGTAVDPALASSMANAVNAFALPSGSADSALLVSVGPGAYTMQVSGAGGTTGIALAEIYEAP
jgi:hypothetical protein